MPINAVKGFSVKSQKGVIVKSCSVESQKGINAVKTCSVENQKGTMPVQPYDNRVLLVLKGTLLNSINILLAVKYN